jgi:dihydroorotate dehydrogenase (fumarate)
VIEAELTQWLIEHEHATARELIGCRSQLNCPDAAEYERSQYMRAIQTFQPPEAVPRAPLEGWGTG